MKNNSSDVMPYVHVGTYVRELQVTGHTYTTKNYVRVQVSLAIIPGVALYFALFTAGGPTSVIVANMINSMGKTTVN